MTGCLSRAQRFIHYIYIYHFRVFSPWLCFKIILPSIATRWGHQNTYTELDWISEAAFHLEVKVPSTTVPTDVIKRCYGKQTPIAPHKQRLLVASSKDATIENAKEKPQKAKKTTTKSKGKGKGDAKSKKVTPPKSAPPDGEVAPKSKTPYAEAKSVFINKFLDNQPLLLVVLVTAVLKLDFIILKLGEWESSVLGAPFP